MKVAFILLARTECGLEYFFSDKLSRNYFSNCLKGQGCTPHPPQHLFWSKSYKLPGNATSSKYNINSSPCWKWMWAQRWEFIWDKVKRMRNIGPTWDSFHPIAWRQQMLQRPFIWPCPQIVMGLELTFVICWIDNIRKAETLLICKMTKLYPFFMQTLETILGRVTCAMLIGKSHLSISEFFLIPL